MQSVQPCMQPGVAPAPVPDSAAPPPCRAELLGDELNSDAAQRLKSENRSLKRELRHSSVTVDRLCTEVGGGAAGRCC